MIIGLTGGIGSGKSTVAKLFEILGFALFNSDDEAKLVYFEPQVREQIILLLGPEAYLSESAINKAHISALIFSDKKLLQKINNIIHPAVKERFLRFISSHPNKMIIKETALLFEAGLENDVDLKIIVAANTDLRIKRVMQRDGLSHDEVLRKINNQWPQEEKIKKSDFVIYNNEDDFLITQVLSIVKKINTR